MRTTYHIRNGGEPSVFRRSCLGLCQKEILEIEMKIHDRIQEIQQPFTTFLKT